MGHGGGPEEAAAGLGEPARPAVGTATASAVGGDAGVGVHLAVEFGDEQEGEARAKVGGAAGALPDAGEAIEAVPDGLGSQADFVAAHGGMRHEHFRALWRRDKPVAGERDAGDGGSFGGLGFFPAFKVDGAGEGGEHDELGEGEAGFPG